MDYCKKIEPFQTLDSDGKSYHFDPDSSPDAWRFYAEVYTDNYWRKYCIAMPQFFTYVKNGVKANGDTYNYIASNTRKNNRLVAISDNATVEDKWKTRHYRAQLRMAGDTDFNFNYKHTHLLHEILANTKSLELKIKGESLLEKCKAAHHSLLNFSLMQVMGDMQGFKGRCCDDRLDRFVFFLREYYNLEENEEKENSHIIVFAPSKNRDNLIEYLDSFKSEYDYCKKVYFIQEESFVDRLCTTGSRLLKTTGDVIEYMEIAQHYWEIREKYFTQNTIIQCRMCGIKKPQSAYTNEPDVCNACTSASDIV